MVKTELNFKICYFVCTFLILGSVFLFPSFSHAEPTYVINADLPLDIVNVFDTDTDTLLSGAQSVLSSYGVNLENYNVGIFLSETNSDFVVTNAIVVLNPSIVDHDFLNNGYYTIRSNVNTYVDCFYNGSSWTFSLYGVTDIRNVTYANILGDRHNGLCIYAFDTIYEQNSNPFYAYNEPVLIPGLQDLLDSGSFLSGTNITNWEKWTDIVPDQNDTTVTSSDTDNWLKKIYNNIVDFKNKVVDGITDILDSIENGINKVLDSINFGIAKIVEFIQSIQDGSFISKLLTPSDESIQALYDEFSDEVVFYNNCYEYGAALSTSMGSALAYQHETAPSLTMNSFSIGGVTVPEQEISFDWFVDVKLFSDPIISVFLIGGYCWFLFTRLPSFIKGIPTQPSNHKKE